MSTWYLDPELGTDTEGTPYGWWKRAFTGGTQPTPAVDELVTGATSGATAKICYITLSSGSWAAGSAAGTMYFYGKTGTFVSEQVNCAGGGHFHITGDLTICAWKTLSGGATGARITAGDIIRMKKSPAPVKLTGATGQATWTDLSKTVTLAEAQTANIDMCESAWTANPAGDATVTLTGVATDAKEGSYCMKIAFDASVQNSIMQAYFATGDLNLSSYYRISFWLKTDLITGIAANQLEVALCSDTAGTTVVDSFPIPASTILGSGYWTPVTITKSGGGTLGASIKSICIRTGSAASGLASKSIYVDDFFACSLTGLSLNSLLTKNSAEQGGAEGLYPIQSINGTTVMIDNSTNAKSNQGRGYTGTTELVDTYFREGFQVRANGVSTIWSFSESGSASSWNELQGGYDPATNLQSGESVFDGLSSTGVLFSSTARQYWKVNWIQCWRYMIGLYLQGTSCNYWLIDNYSGGGCNNEPIRMHGYYQVANNLRNLCNSATQGISAAYNSVIHELGNVSNNMDKGIYFFTNNADIWVAKNIRNNAGNGIDLTGNNNRFGKVNNLSDNTGYGCYFNGSGNVIDELTTSNNNVVLYFGAFINFIRKATIGEAFGGATVAGASVSSNPRWQIDKYNGNTSLVLSEGAYVISQAATAGGTGLEWKAFITDVIRDTYYRFSFIIARVYCNANKTTTVKAYFKQSHASNIASRLICRKYQLAGIDTDITDDCSADTNRNELSIDISPTASGVVEIEAEVWYVSTSTTESVIVDGKMTITEA